MSLYHAIKHIYPDIKDDDFIVYDDGNGAVIREWLSESPKPTNEELNAAWDEVKDMLPPDPLEELSEVDKLKEENVKLKEELEKVREESQMNAFAIMDLAEMLLQ